MAKKKEPDLDAMMDRVAHIDSMAVTSINDDPTVPTTVILTLDQVIPCPYNPRKQRNTKYDEIKSSIQATGLDHAPNVTRESASDPYMIRDGGNTRLAILNELWKETGDDKFYRITCQFHPWEGVERLLVGHLIENDLRSDTLFIERAEAAALLKTMLEKSGNEELSIREAARRFSERGWTIGQSQLTLLFFAHGKLLPHCPQALWGGMGTTKIREIRRLYSAFRKYAESLSLDAGELDKHWIKALEEVDGEFFDISQLEADAAHRVAEALGTYSHIVAGEIQSILRGNQPSGELSPKRQSPMADTLREIANAEAKQRTAKEQANSVSVPHETSDTTTNETTVNAPADNSTPLPSQPDAVITQGDATTPAPLSAQSLSVTPALDDDGFFDWANEQRVINHAYCERILELLDLPVEFVRYVSDFYGFMPSTACNENQHLVSEWARPYLLLMFYLAGNFDIANFSAHQRGLSDSEQNFCHYMLGTTGGEVNEGYIARMLMVLLTDPQRDVSLVSDVAFDLIANVRLMRRTAVDVIGDDIVLKSQLEQREIYHAWVGEFRRKQDNGY